MVEQIEAIDAALPALNLRREELADIELQLFLDALLRYGGYDFRNFNQSALRRRIADAMRSESITTISGLQDRLLHDERALAAFLVSMSGGTSQLFHSASLLLGSLPRLLALGLALRELLGRRWWRTDFLRWRRRRLHGSRCGRRRRRRTAHRAGIHHGCLDGECGRRLRRPTEDEPPVHERRQQGAVQQHRERNRHPSIA